MHLEEPVASDLAVEESCKLFRSVIFSCGDSLSINVEVISRAHSCHLMSQSNVVKLANSGPVDSMENHSCWGIAGYAMSAMLDYYSNGR